MTQSKGVFSQLPFELRYLVEPAKKYGVYQSDEERLQFLERIDASEMDELARTAERYRTDRHAELVSKFFDDYPITKHAESAMLHELLSLMDSAGLRLSPENWNTVETHIRSLRQHGNFRLASDRAIAARFLADFGRAGDAAIPALRLALHDEDLRVQVWAHFALACIEGNSAEHERAVSLIYADHNKKDSLGCHIDDVGGEACEVLKEFKRNQALS